MAFVYSLSDDLELRDYCEDQRGATDDILAAIFGDDGDDYDYKIANDIVKGFYDPNNTVVIKDNFMMLENGDASISVKSVLTHVAMLDSGGVSVKPLSYLPPSRNESVTGQEKLCVDVMLAVEHLRPTDSVVVVGSYSESRGGQAYKLLTGLVSEVNLYDPYEPSTREEILVSKGKATVFKYFKEAWPLDKYLKCDVFFNDAYVQRDGKGFVVDIPFDARVYSLKRFRGDVFFKEKSFRYDQIKRTERGEWREVSHARTRHSYIHQLGSCACCRELSYVGSEYSDIVLSQWSLVHGYSPCTLGNAHRRLDVRYLSLELGVLSVRPIHRRRRDKVYAPLKVLDQPTSCVVVGSASMSEIVQVAARYIEFELCDIDSGVVYATDGYGDLISRKLLDYHLLESSFVDRGVFVVGSRVFKIDFRGAKSSKNMYSGTGLIRFFQYVPDVAHQIQIFSRGTKYRSFRNLAELDSFVSTLVRGVTLREGGVFRF